MERIGENLFEEKIRSDDYVIIDFSSPGCAPCKKIPPLLEEIISENGDINISAFEVDVTENPSAAQNYFVLGVPTIIIFRNGKELKRFNSVPGKDKIVKVLK